ncbi:MAG: bifunctional phosphopantothenoylcysteine decarboxylase/phosphopantothenate--cysteine ligase CoaBC, partial [Candidatus Eremiobacteraeota bacterium]|nr:bifunctional phosphopantothenoylcysteine decarboxylase/phosphopantothenate--cysteine ligase CoaBC [Candidatus Eremiobacteraeota bacterium]
MKGASILLGVCGGIAAYKAVSLTSALIQSGATVDVIMTRNALRFVTALSFSALTRRPVYETLWDNPDQIPHIRLVREADLVAVVPATANLLAKLAGGVADDLLTTALLAARVPVLLAPAMNSAMYDNAATQENIRMLRERNYEFVEPERGYLAEGERGIGRLADEETLLASITVTLERRRSLEGTRVVVTAGPTREAFDPVRYISNPSTGAMGIALANEARARGAEVTLVLGPTLLPEPPGVTTVRVATAQEMYEAALVHA